MSTPQCNTDHRHVVTWFTEVWEMHLLIFLLGIQRRFKEGEPDSSDLSCGPCAFVFANKATFRLRVAAVFDFQVMAVGSTPVSAPFSGLGLLKWEVTFPHGPLQKSAVQLNRSAASFGQRQNSDTSVAISCQPQS